MIQQTVLGLVVELVGQTWVDGVCLWSAFNPLLAPDTQLFLQQNHIPGVALVRRIGEIANEWYEPDHKVECHIHLHAHFDGR